MRFALRGRDKTVEIQIFPIVQSPESHETRARARERERSREVSRGSRSREPARLLYFIAVSPRSRFENRAPRMRSRMSVENTLNFVVSPDEIYRGFECAASKTETDRERENVSAKTYAIVGAKRLRRPRFKRRYGSIYLAETFPYIFYKIKRRTRRR